MSSSNTDTVPMRQLTPLQRCASFMTTLPSKASLATFLTLLTLPITSNILSADQLFNDQDMLITALVALTTFALLAFLLLLRPNLGAWRDRVFHAAASFLLVLVFYFPILLTGMADGGFGWVIGVALAVVVSLVQRGCTQACCRRPKSINSNMAAGTITQDHVVTGVVTEVQTEVVTEVKVVTPSQGV